MTISACPAPAASARLGFQRLVAAIGLGEVGIVLVTEVSRLSRRNSDWHRVIELCAVFRTLIADEDGVYDAQDPNDLLLLGVKGTLFAAELHILHARMRGNLLNKARRGELALRLPVGYRRLGDGTVVLEPDEQVRATLALLFERFALLRNARAVQRYFARARPAMMPRLIQQGAEAGRIVWVRPTYQMIQQVLTSPVYAGVFVYGRRQRQVAPGDPPVVADRRRPVEEWDIVVPGVYPAYLSYDQYLLNRRQLRDNLYNFAAKGRGAPREGRALLQGLVVCGRCGRRMSVSHGSRYLQLPMPPRADRLRGAAVSGIPGTLTWTGPSASCSWRRCSRPRWRPRWRRSRCSSASARRSTGTGSCGSSGRATRRSAPSVSTTPPSRRTARWPARSRRAGTRRWRRSSSWSRNTPIVRRTELLPLGEAEQQTVRRLAEDLPALWHAATTTDVDRKRLLRLVVREVVLTAHAKERRAEVVIVWSGGATTRHDVRCPPWGWHGRTDPDVGRAPRRTGPRLPGPPDRDAAQRRRVAYPDRQAVDVRARVLDAQAARDRDGVPAGEPRWRRAGGRTDSGQDARRNVLGSRRRWSISGSGMGCWATSSGGRPPRSGCGWARTTSPASTGPAPWGRSCRGWSR